MGNSDSKLPITHRIPADMTTRPFPRRFDVTYKQGFVRIVATLHASDPPNNNDEGGAAAHHHHHHLDGKSSRGQQQQQQQPYAAVSWPTGWYGSMTFHGGPTKDDEPLATARLAGRLGSNGDFKIILPTLTAGLQGQGQEQEQRTEIMRCSSSFRHERWWFAMEIGGGGTGTGAGPAARVERFEWRRSRGAEVKGVEGGSKWRSGWKLVRMGIHNDDMNAAAAAAAASLAPVGNNGDDNDHMDDLSGAEEESGRTSDGKEVVAVWADAGGLSMSRVGAFEFRGSGATGELGLRWSIMAVVTYMCLWQVREQRNLSAATASAAA